MAMLRAGTYWINTDQVAYVLGPPGTEGEVEAEELIVYFAVPFSGRHSGTQAPFALSLKGKVAQPVREWLAANEWPPGGEDTAVEDLGQPRF